MLNPRKSDAPATLTRLLAGERGAPGAKPPPAAKPSSSFNLWDLPPGQLLGGICISLICALICFTLGVVVGRYQSANPSAAAQEAPALAQNTPSPMPPGARKEDRDAAVAEAVSKSPKVPPLLPLPVAKPKTTPGMPVSPVSPADAAKTTLPGKRVGEYPAPGKSSPGASAAPAAPSHDAAAAAVAAGGTPPPQTGASQPPAKAPAASPSAPQTPAPGDPKASSEAGAKDTAAKDIPAKEPVEKKDAAAKDAAQKGTAAKDKADPVKETKGAANLEDSPEADMAKPKENSSPPAKPGYHSSIQVASFEGANRQAVAEEYKKRLEKNSDLKIELVPSEDGRWVRVLVGSFDSPEAASRECEKLRKRAGLSGAFVKKR